MSIHDHAKQTQNKTRVDAVAVASALPGGGPRALHSRTETEAAQLLSTTWPVKSGVWPGPAFLRLAQGHTICENTPFSGLPTVVDKRFAEAGPSGTRGSFGALGSTFRLSYVETCPLVISPVSILIQLVAQQRTAPSDSSDCGQVTL